MKKNKMINSHVYLARSILNKFSYRGKNNAHMIKYIDTNDMIIKEKSTKKFNSELGYYSYNNEQLLKNNIEEKIGIIIHKLEENRKNNITDFVLLEKDKFYLTTYLAYQWLRSESLVENIKKHFNLDIRSNYLKNELINEENTTNLIGSKTCDMDICILFNNSNKGFVINSSNSLLYKDSHDYYIITLVLTPNIAVRFCKEDILKQVFSLENNYMVISITDDNSIINENIRTYNAAYKSTPGFIVGKESDLIDILNIVSNKKD